MTQTMPSNGDHLEFLLSGEKDPNHPYGAMDAMEWAKSFVQMYPQMEQDVMLGWFANAIMTGYDKGFADADKTTENARNIKIH